MKVRLTKKIKLLSILVILTIIAMPLSIAVNTDSTNKNINNSINISQNNSIIDKTKDIKGVSQPVPQIVPKIAPNFVAILDNFNRPDGPIGPKWVNNAGKFVVSNNVAMGAGSTNLATYNGVYSNVAEADIQSVGTGLEYVGLVLGYRDINNNLFVKFQNSDGAPGFDQGACYVGNNGITGSFGLGLFTLDQPFTTAHLKTEWNGNTVYITLSNIDGTSNSQAYICIGAPYTGGSAIGINSFTTMSNIDNFAADGASIDTLYVFARGGDNALWYKASDGNTWSSWISLGGTITADPESTKFNGNTYVFARGSDGALWYRKFDGIWSGWASLGGFINGGVGAS